MMGVEAPKTCWATHKRQVINLWKCCIWLVNLFELLTEMLKSKKDEGKEIFLILCIEEFCCLLLQNILLFITSKYLNVRNIRWHRYFPDKAIEIHSMFQFPYVKISCAISSRRSMLSCLKGEFAASQMLLRRHARPTKPFCSRNSSIGR